MRKLKFSGVWAVTTVAVIAIIIALNYVFTALSGRFALYLDMTKAQYYDISETTEELLSDVEDDINIIFCTPLDKLSDNSYSAMIYTLAKNYAAKFDNISIEYLDWRRETERANNYTRKMANATIDDKTIIIDCPSKASRRLTWDDMLAYDSDGVLFGFRGEIKFTSSILQVTGERPIVAFTTNHSEDMVGAAALKELFDTAGYDVREINLSTDNIPEDTRILITFNPKNDFLGEEGMNEFEKIDNFTADLGNLIVFLGSTDRTELPELYSYLKENWYINVDYGVVKDTADHALSIDGTNIAATFAPEGLGSEMVKNILDNNQSAPTVSSAYSVALSVAEGGDSTSGEVHASHVLTTSDKAEFYKDGVLTDSGTFGLMTLSMRMKYVDNDPVYNHVLVSASSEFANYTNLQEKVNEYANDDILYAAMMAMGKNNVPDELEVKKFDDDSLDLTVAQANTWTVIFAVCIPVILMATGIVVYLRRKHL